MDKKKIYDKWSPIIGSLGVTGSKADWLSQYAESISGSLDNISTQSNTFESSILPMSMKVAAQTIGLNLVPVVPMGGKTQEEIERIESEIKAENRDGKIESLIEDKEYVEKKREDHPDWSKGGPSGQLFYLDYKYGSTQSV